MYFIRLLIWFPQVWQGRLKNPNRPPGPSLTSSLHCHPLPVLSCNLGGKAAQEDVCVCVWEGSGPYCGFDMVFSCVCTDADQLDWENKQQEALTFLGDVSGGAAAPLPVKPSHQRWAMHGIFWPLCKMILFYQWHKKRWRFYSSYCCCLFELLQFLKELNLIFIIFFC